MPRDGDEPPTGPPRLGSRQKNPLLRVTSPTQVSPCAGGSPWPEVRLADPVKKRQAS